uniref:Uncharacterized protein n=1 Tax=Utricularia reniformis TaxID=192314 RepID=A0A1Y0B268_9LAMI|nr:hypothetical protein AEK19_MT1255 [Utricularia reniformis]ART31463.1 hypothetical protein AEK19_MT1255 [Utricularia reniformis]
MRSLEPVALTAIQSSIPFLVDRGFNLTFRSLHPPRSEHIKHDKHVCRRTSDSSSSCLS